MESKEEESDKQADSEFGPENRVTSREWNKEKVKEEFLIREAGLEKRLLCPRERVRDSFVPNDTSELYMVIGIHPSQFR